MYISHLSFYNLYYGITTQDSKEIKKFVLNTMGLIVDITGIINLNKSLPAIKNDGIKLKKNIKNINVKYLYYQNNKLI